MQNSSSLCCCSTCLWLARGKAREGGGAQTPGHPCTGLCSEHTVVDRGLKAVGHTLVLHSSSVSQQDSVAKTSVT
jgi:hypothetical protein